MVGNVTQRILRKLAAILVLLGVHGTVSAAISVNDNNTHVDRGVLYTNAPFLTASGGTAPYTYTATAGVPTGITVNPDGTVSGLTCGSNGTFTLTLTVTDGVGNSASPSNMRLIVNAAPAGGCSLSFTSSTLPGGAVGVAYNGAVTATGGTSPYSYSVASGSLPPGLSLNLSTGAVSGTPAAAGSSAFTIYVSDSSGNTGSQSYSIVIAASAPTITLSPTSLSAATAGTAYNQSFTASGGTSPYTYAVTSGSLPAGLSLGSGGALTGTPTAAGSFSFTITATDANSYTGNQALSLAVNAPTVSVSLGGSGTGTVGASYNQTFSASGGTGPYTYAVTGGSLPPGVTLDGSTGALSGTPTTPGSYSFTVTATDSNGYTGSQSVSFTVNAAPTVSLSPTSLTAGTAGSGYSETFTASGGTSPYTYAVTSGSLPAGLSLGSSGALSGTPTAAGSYSFTITATDADGFTGSQAVSLTINAAPTVSLSLGGASTGAVGSSYNQTFSASGGTGPYTYAVTAGSLPAGLTLDSNTGVLSGMPSTAGNFSFTVTATDADGYTGSQAVSFTVGQSDPTQESDFRALLAGEASAIRRFTATQITNVARRLEELQYDSGSSGQVCLNVPAPQSEDAADRSQPASSQACLDTQSGKNALAGLAVWVTGTLEYGDTAATDSMSGSRFSTSGITLGADYRLPDNRVIGIALGYGSDDIAVGQTGSETGAQNLNLIGYGGWAPLPNVRLNLVAGIGATDLDVQRRIALDDSLVGGERTADGAFGAFIASTGIDVGVVRVAAYFRTDYLNARLGSFQETGATTLALAYDTATLQSASMTFGARASYPLTLPIGSLEPSVRVEFQNRHDDAMTQVVRYADSTDGSAYAYTLPASRHQIASLGAGLRYALTPLATARIEYLAQYSDGALLSSTVRGNVAVSF